MPSLLELWLRQQGVDQVLRETPASAELKMYAPEASAGAGPTVIEILSHGSATGFAAISNGDADVAMSSRQVRSAEVEQLAHLGSLNDARHEVVLALDGVAVIVHPENSLTQLSISQLRAVFAGDFKQWSRLGSVRGAINVYARDDNPGTFEVFKNLVLGSAKLTASTTRFESNQELARQVAGDTQGIGFTGLAYTDSAKTLAVSGGGEAVAPTRLSIATEDYPLSRRLYLYLPEPDNQVVQSLVSTALSDSGQAVVAVQQFIALDLFTTAMEVPVDAPDEYRQLTAASQRLSLNFRFMARALLLIGV